MSAFRIVPLSAALVAIATAAAAPPPAGNVESTLRLEPGAMPPVMDQSIFAHVIFNELEGRWNVSNTEFRWEGQGRVGTDYDKLWIKSEGTLQGNGTLEDGQDQFLYSRAIATYFDLQGGLRSDLDSRPRAIGLRSASRVSRLTFSILKSPGLSVARAISPPSWRPPTIFCSPSGSSCSRKSS